MKKIGQRVVFQPETYQKMQKGINLLVEAVRPTLGPLPRIVALEGFDRNKTPELLDSGGIIARRILALPDGDEDMGAMFVRQVLWRVHEQVGDGTVTAAVILQAVYNQALRYVVAGGNPMLLRGYLIQGLRLILDQLGRVTTPLRGKEKLARVAESICYDPPLAKIMGEIFDIIGEYGHLDIRSGRSRDIERGYVEGMYWEGGVLTREMISDRTQLRTDLQNASILISDLELQDPHQLLPVLKMVNQAGIQALMIVARQISESVIALLLSANRALDEFQAIAVKTPTLTSTEQITALQDLAALTGGQPVLQGAGDTLGIVRLEHLGRARRAWADRDHMGIIGGKGDPKALRAHIAHLRAAFERATEQDDRARLQKRIGKLMGGSATLWVGGATENEIKARKERAERAANVLRGAVREGVLPGGGVALLDCRPALQERLDQSANSDERAAYHILIKAMEAPTRAILSNAGHDASKVMAAIKLAGPSQGFDVRSNQIVDLVQVGVWDSAAVLKAAVRGAVAGAALALTTDVLIHRRIPKESLNP